MLKIVHWCRQNVSLLTLSGSALTLASIHGLKVIYKNSNDNSGVFIHRMAAAGLWMIIGDTVNAMIYKSKYPFEPLFPVENERRPVNPSLIFQTVETICNDAVPCITCSLYVHYDLPLCARFQFLIVKIASEVDWFFKNVFRPKCTFWKTPFVELFLAGNMVSFGLLNDNQFAVMAAAPYQLAAIFFNPGNYYSRKNKRIVYNFLMIPYVACVTEALCQSVKAPTDIGIWK